MQSTLPTWDEYYLEVAKSIAQRSDPGVTSAGTVIVSDAHRLVAAGFERTGEHAELHAVGSAASHRLPGGTAYSTRRPCDACYADLALTGIYHICWPGGGSHTSAYWATAQNPLLRSDWNALNING